MARSGWRRVETSPTDAAARSSDESESAVELTFAAIGTRVIRASRQRHGGSA